MAIRVQHGGVGTIAGLAQQAGQATAERESAARQLQITRQLLSQQHQRQMAEFDADLQLEKMKRAEVWEMEKMELASRNDFARLEKVRELDMLDEYEKLKRQQNERERKIEAINKTDWLSADEKAQAIFQVETNIPIVKPPTPLFTTSYTQKVLGGLATGIYRDREEMIADASSKLGIDFEKNFPRAMDIINQKMPIEEEKPSIWERIGAWWKGDETAKSLGPPTKPKWLIDYPNAVWNPEIKAWTVIKDGKIVALSEE